MIFQFDHRFGSYVGQTEAQDRQGKLPELTEEQHQNPFLLGQPRYWMEETLADNWLSRYTAKSWLMVYRDITSTNLMRTSVFAVIPRVPPVDPCRGMFFDAEVDTKLASCFLASANSFVFDYVSRQKFSGNHLAIFVLQQLPVIPPHSYTAPLLNFILSRVLELTYTA